MKLDLEYFLNKYADMVLRLSYSYLKNTADAQDASQIVFTKLFTKPKSFQDTNHEKAYILRITANVCKDMLKHSFRTRTCTIEHLSEIVAPENSTILWAVNELDTKYRIVIYLHYYEGYKAKEISKILKVPTSTIHTRLVRGRTILKNLLGDDEHETISKRPIKPTMDRTR